MLPIHLLIQNLLYDVSQIVIPFDNVDEELIAKPQRWQPEEVSALWWCLDRLAPFLT